jgi:tellurite resistance protein
MEMDYMLNGIKIMNLEGSQILKNNLEGMSINKDYKAVFPNSLLLDKLKELKLKVSDNNTTRDIISVNFGYGYTSKAEFNILDDKINKCKNRIDELNVEIDTCNEEIKKQSKNKDKKPFSKHIKVCERGKRRYKKLVKLYRELIDKMKMDSKDIRTKLYNEGFYLDFYKKDKSTKEYKLDQRIYYKFWFRSPSKSRIGEVCFLNVKRLNNIRTWQTMGLQLPKTNARLVEYEAYLSLTSSCIEDKIIIDPETEILVLNDLDTFKETYCTRVFINENGECEAKDETTQVKSTLWDGLCLLDDSCWNGATGGMKLLRQHFFKSCGFRTFISRFLKDWCEENKKDYNTYTVKDRYNRDVFVKDIKMIATENSMKWEKFTDIGASFDYWCNKVEEDGNVFGVAKEDHPSKYKEFQRMSYQQINTLPIDEKQSIKLCNDTIEHVNNLKVNNALYLDFLERTKSDVNANEMMIDLYKNNTKFANSEFFRTYKTKNISEYKETLRAGKLLTEGDNLTVCGNVYPLLLHAVGEVPYTKDSKGKCILDRNYTDPTLPKIDKGYSVYTTRFCEEACEIAMFRNPHNATNNIMLGVLHKDELKSKYFNFSKNIIEIDMIRTDCQARANGLDMDSDFCLCTINETAVESAIEALKYPTIVNDIPEEKIPYNNTMNDLVNIDEALAEGKYSIGTSSNLAAKALSFYWKYKTDELKNIVAIASVLAQVAIDNSKRKYEVSLTKEITRISKLDCMQVKINKDKKIVRLNENATEDEKKKFNKLLTAKPFFWQFVKEIKEKEVKEVKVKKVKEIDIDGNKLSKEDIKTQRLENKAIAVISIIEAKTEAKQKKNKKVDSLKKHCIDEKICPMDWIQAGIDTIQNAYTNDKCIDDYKFIQPVEGKSDDRQRDKIKTIVTELDNLYKAHFDNVAEGKEQDDESWEVEQLIKTKDTLDKIKKFSIQPKTMQMLIEDAFKSNKKYKRKLLNCLYKSHTELFLQGFKKAE